MPSQVVINGLGFSLSFGPCGKFEAVFFHEPCFLSECWYCMGSCLPLHTCWVSEATRSHNCLRRMPSEVELFIFSLSVACGRPLKKKLSSPNDASFTSETIRKPIGLHIVSLSLVAPWQTMSYGRPRRGPIYFGWFNMRCLFENSADI